MTFYPRVILLSLSVLELSISLIINHIGATEHKPQLIRKNIDKRKRSNFINHAKVSHAFAIGLEIPKSALSLRKLVGTVVVCQFVLEMVFAVIYYYINAFDSETLSNLFKSSLVQYTIHFQMREKKQLE